MRARKGVAEVPLSSSISYSTLQEEEGHRSRMYGSLFDCHIMIAYYAVLGIVTILNFVSCALQERVELSWTQRAAEEAEAVASISCSGHGRAYLDGSVVDGKPVYESKKCFGGPDCSQFFLDYIADANREKKKQKQKKTGATQQH